MMGRLLALLACCWLFSCAQAARAELIVYNGSGPYNIDGYCGSCGAAGVYTLFDDFALGQSYDVFTVEWDAGFYHPNTTSIQIGVWSNMNAGQVYSRTVTLADALYYSVNQSQQSGQNLTLAFALPNLALAKGHYWLSLSGDDMHFTTVQGGGGNQIAKGDLGTGFNPHHNLTLPFRLYGNPLGNDGEPASDVPEPAAIMLLFIGLVGLFSLRLQKH